MGGRRKPRVPISGQQLSTTSDTPSWHNAFKLDFGEDSTFIGAEIDNEQTSNPGNMIKSLCMWLCDTCGGREIPSDMPYLPMCHVCTDTCSYLGMWWGANLRAG